MLSPPPPTLPLKHDTQVKATVDSFGAFGIDIDYEAESASQWSSELVGSNVFHYLRVAMPAPQYTISFTIGGITPTFGTPQSVQAAFNPPLSTAYDNSGVALPTIQQNWNDIDFVQLMTCMWCAASDHCRIYICMFINRKWGRN